MKIKMCMVHFIAATWIGVGASAASAALHSYSGSAVIATSSLPADVAVGDVFHFSFTYDDQITDTDIDTDNGIFMGATTSFSLASEPGNSGSWNPSGGAFTFPQRVDTTDDINESGDIIDSIFVDAEGTGFPTLDGEAFDSVSLYLATTALGFVNDTGAGQTLGAQLGGPLPADLSFYDYALKFQIDTEVGIATGTITALSVIREPASLALLGLGGLVVLRRGRRVTN